MLKKWVLERAHLYFKYSGDNIDRKIGFLEAIGMFGLLHDSEIRKIRKQYGLYSEEPRCTERQ